MTVEGGDKGGKAGRQWMPKRHRAVLCCCGMCIVFVCAADEEAEAEAEAEARKKQMYLVWSFVNVCVQCQDPAGFHPFIKVVVALIRLLCIFSLLL